MQRSTAGKCSILLIFNTLAKLPIAPRSDLSPEIARKATGVELRGAEGEPANSRGLITGTSTFAPAGAVPAAFRVGSDSAWILVADEPIASR
jgi:hypothetical protein